MLEMINILKHIAFYQSRVDLSMDDYNENTETFGLKVGVETIQIPTKIFSQVINIIENERFSPKKRNIKIVEGEVSFIMKDGAYQCQYLLNPTKDLMMITSKDVYDPLALIYLYLFYDNTVSLPNWNNKKFVSKRDLSVLDPVIPRMLKLSRVLEQVVVDNKDYFGEAQRKSLSRFSIGHLIEEWTSGQKLRYERNSESVKHFEVTDKMINLAKGYASGKVLSVTADGLAGGGKTTGFRIIANLLELPYYSYNCSANTLESHLLGDYVLKNGEMVWIDGPFTEAFRLGGFFVMEEINRTRADITAFLNNALDGVGVLQLSSGELVGRHKAFRFGMAFNQGYAGTKPLDLSLFNRMNRRWYVPSMTSDEMRNALIVEFPTVDTELIKLCVEVAKDIEKKYIDDAVSNAVISVRNVIDWINEYLAEGDLYKSSLDTIVYGTCLDVEVCEEVINNKLSMFQGKLEKWS